jgi:hypothetical protein
MRGGRSIFARKREPSSHCAEKMEGRTQQPTCRTCEGQTGETFPLFDERVALPAARSTGEERLPYESKRGGKIAAGEVV